MPCDNKALLKFLEVIVCGIGLMYKIWTTWESERVIVALEKLSQEGSLSLWAHFTQASSLASIFIDLTFGSYFIITACLFVGHIAGDQRTTTENLFLIIGLIMMIIVGGILILSVDDVPDRLLDNAIILGIIAFIAGILFFIDAGTKCQSKERKIRSVPSVQPKRQIEIIPKVEEMPIETKEIIEDKVDSKQSDKEEDVKKQSAQKSNGIKSVEIRIKEPPNNWPGYGQQGPVRLPQIESLEDAERVDALLHAQHAEEPVPAQTRRGTASLHASPVRHTSSFYIGTPFSWRRLNNEQSK